MAVHVEAQLVRLANARRQPGGIEGAVELDADEPVRLRLADVRDRLGLAGRDVGHLRGVCALAVDQRRGVDVRREQRAGGSALAPLERADSSLPGSRTDVTPSDNSCRPV